MSIGEPKMPQAGKSPEQSKVEIASISEAIESIKAVAEEVLKSLPEAEEAINELQESSKKGNLSGTQEFSAGLWLRAELEELSAFIDEAKEDDLQDGIKNSMETTLKTYFKIANPDDVERPEQNTSNILQNQMDKMKKLDEIFTSFKNIGEKK